MQFLIKKIDNKLKLIAYFFIIFLLLISTLKTFAQTDPCSNYADLMSKSNNNLFVGFGTGINSKEADNQAQIDLASRIRQNVSSTSTVTASNENSILNSQSKSVVCESLVGAKVARRCSSSNNFSTVMTLDKSLFTNSIENKIQFYHEQMLSIINTLKTSKNEIVITKNIDDAKKLISNYQQNYESDFQLCKLFNGCSNLSSQNLFSQLGELISKFGDRDIYLFQSNKDPISLDFQDEIIGQLDNENIKTKVISKNESQQSHNFRTIKSKCSSRIGNIIQESNDRLFEVNCVVESFSGNQKGFRKTYSCKAIMDNSLSKNKANQLCFGKLKQD